MVFLKAMKVYMFPINVLVFVFPLNLVSFFMSGP